MSPTEITGFPLRHPVSGGTHLLWCGLAFFLIALFWRLTQGCRLRRWSILTFGVSMFLLYGASGLYHSLRAAPNVLNFFRLLDHSMIYVLIAGTYTPMGAILLRGRSRMIMLIGVWSLAAVGIVCKWLFAAPPYPVTVGLYVALGWIGVLPIRQLIRAVGVRGMAWALLGGLLYTAGGVCDAVKWPTICPGLIGPHEMLHLLDMAATVVHIYFILCCVLPYRAPDEISLYSPVFHAAFVCQSPETSPVCLNFEETRTTFSDGR
jgi:hemolysin III